MKKVLKLMSILVFMIPYFFMPMNVQGKTLGDIKRELQAKQEEYDNNKNEKELTQSQINEANANIANIRKTIDQTNQDIINLSNEIVKLNQDIEVKKQEIKEILNFVQVSSGESAYLEYAFGAKTFTDFIYRAAVAEQLSKYNDNLIKQFNQMIEDNKQKTIDLGKKQEELKVKQNEVAKELAKLGEKSKSLNQESLSIEEELKAIRESIKNLENMNCKDGDDIDVCTRGRLPATTALYRPVVSGHISSRFGSRTYTLNGKVISDIHYGIDMSKSGEIPVYASGAGLVGKILTKTSCGGNWVIIWHNVNGRKYTTVYMHLRYINVQEGQTVSMNTQIGVMGGDPSRETWDGCSSGQHLHFGMATGYYYSDYQWYSEYVAHNIDPASVVNFPAGYTSFSDRYTAY